MNDNIQGFARDKNTYALLNLDVQGYEEYKKQREQSMKFNGLQNEVEGLKKDIHDIKDLLLKLVNGNKND